MNQSQLIQQILDDLDDNTPRLIFADWLAENGQVDRADWIRASCELENIEFGDTKWEPAARRVGELFERCRPKWWESITSVTQENDRGLFRFQMGAGRSTRGPEPAKRLGAATWLAQAMSEGWLQRIEVLWDDGSVGETIDGWQEPASLVPLLVKPAPQICDRGLRRLIGLKQLEGLILDANVLENSSVHELETCKNLLDLSVEFRNVSNDTVDMLIRQMASLNLRYLEITGHDLLEYGQRPNDSDLRELGAIRGLKRLTLADSPAVTENGISEIRKMLPHLALQRSADVA